MYKCCHASRAWSKPAIVSPREVSAPLLACQGMLTMYYMHAFSWTLARKPTAIGTGRYELYYASAHITITLCTELLRTPALHLFRWWLTGWHLQYVYMYHSSFCSQWIIMVTAPHLTSNCLGPEVPHTSKWAIIAASSRVCTRSVCLRRWVCLPGP